MAGGNNSWHAVNKLKARKIHAATIYAHRHNLDPKDVGIYKNPKGFCMVNLQATRKELDLFNKITEEIS